MKRLLIGSLMALTIGTAAFAGMHHGGMRNPAGHHMGRECGYPRNEKARIFIDERRLEIRKELLNEKPDWNKIQRLNSEIADKRAEIKTENMKYRFENRDKINEFYREYHNLNMMKQN